MRTLALATALAAALAGTEPDPPSDGGNLRLSFQDLQPRGQVIVALFARPQDWRTQTHPIRNAAAQVKAGAAELVLDHIPPGSYAVMAFHDRNNNGKLDVTPFGPPLEPYGFSNNARGLFGPPAWSSAVVQVRAGETVVQEIKLR